MGSSQKNCRVYQSFHFFTVTYLHTLCTTPNFCKFSSYVKIFLKFTEKPKLKPKASLKQKRGSQDQSVSTTFFSYSHSAHSSPVSQRRAHELRRGSEKVTSTSVSGKKKITMLDLKTFVESKLLSKSEKALEKLEDVENESEPFMRPLSALGHRDDGSVKKDKILGGDSVFGEQSSLYKGKSMPSLRYN